MRVEAIEPLTALSEDQVDLLRELLHDKHVDRADLVVYRAREGGRRVDIVAPASPDVVVGRTVISAGWVVGAQSASSDGDAVELQLARSLVPE